MHIVRIFKHQKGARVHIPRAYLALLGLNIGDFVAWDAPNGKHLTLRNASKELREQTHGVTK